MFGLFKKKKQEKPAAATLLQNSGSDRMLDCSNMNCPMPIVKISGEIKTMVTGQSLTVVATDPAFKADLEAWIKKTGNQLVSFKDGSIKEAIIQKS